MTGVTEYPDEPAGPFPKPPVEFTDAEGRDVEVRAYEEGDYEDLVEMYDDFDPADRAQGLPPVGEDRIRDWLDILLTGDGYNVVAWDDGDAIGHATLVPDGEGGYELAIFVHQSHQGAGIGTRLIEGLLGHGAAGGAETVWLTVERWNKPAVSLYEKVGFETMSSESFELEMAIRLAGDSDE
ncbi:GNAT family N-acetyltransferase [Halospeciosus flavus]|uniref:GNAT family N-acetyltransferase n=1 Tax=Halospeciosus flavus TaxID=3032283 RepID=A0ABD5Z6U4_9EURY|nr:GNAT family N-acetyltransferase [Halospeciosus flavus]